MEAHWDRGTAGPYGPDLRKKRTEGGRNTYLSPFAVPAPAVTVQRTGPVGSKGACPALKKHFPPAKGKETRRWWWWWGDRRKPPPLRGTRTAVTPTTPKASSPPQSQPAPPRPPYHLQLPPRACALRAPSPAHAQKCVSLSSPLPPAITIATRTPGRPALPVLTASLAW